LTEIDKITAKERIILHLLIVYIIISNNNIQFIG